MWAIWSCWSQFSIRRAIPLSATNSPTAASDPTVHQPVDLAGTRQKRLEPFRQVCDRRGSHGQPFVHGLSPHLQRIGHAGAIGIG